MPLQRIPMPPFTPTSSPTNLQEKFSAEKAISKKVAEWSTMLDKYKGDMDKEAHAALTMRKRLKEKQQVH